MDEDTLEDYDRYERQLSKLLNFMTDIMNGIRVTRVHSRRTEPHTTKNAPMNSKSVN